MGFAAPWALGCAVAIPVLAAWLLVQRRRRQRLPALLVTGHPVASLADLAAASMALAGIAALWVAVARPVYPELATDDGVARTVMLVLDVSASMAESAGQETRGEAARGVVERFLRLRSRDRVGLVVFARWATVVAPLTRDHRTLLDLLRGLRSGEMGSGTAIGDALAVALERMDVLPGGGGVVVVSDGVHNAGALDPGLAAAAAARRGIPIDAVVVGEDAGGFAVMATIAAQTGGHIVSASDAEGLERAFRELSRLRPEPDATPHRRLESRAHLPGALAAVLLGAAVLAEMAARRAWA